MGLTQMFANGLITGTLMIYINVNSILLANIKQPVRGW
jgi:hypothetical protein